MNIIFRMAVRNLVRNKRRTFIIGLVFFLAVFFLIVNIGGSNGLAEDMQNTSRRIFTGDILVMHKAMDFELGKFPSGKVPVVTNAESLVESLSKSKNVSSAIPRIRYGVMISRRQSSEFVGMLGIDPEKEQRITGMKVNSGRFIQKDNEALLTPEYTKKIGANIGDEIDISAGMADGSIKTAKVKIVGILDNHEFNFMRQNTLLVSLEAAQKLLSLEDAATEILLHVNDGSLDEALVSVNQQVENQGLKGEPWKAAGKEIVDSQQGVKFSILFLFMVSVLIILAIVFNLSIMSIYERYKEIGMLLAMGFERRAVVLLLVIEGLILGLLTSLTGGALGFAAIKLLSVKGLNIGMDAAKIFGGSMLYPDISLATAAAVVLSVGLFGGIAALIAAGKVKRIRLHEAMAKS